MQVKDYIRSIENYPVEGVTFRDITPVLQEGPVFQKVIRDLADLVKDLEFDKIAGIEARGFIIGAPLANYLGCGFIPVRKPGKLPYEKISQEYDLEYGNDAIEIHLDAVEDGERILIIDDLLATGGTAQAGAKLVEKAGGKVVACVFLIELAALGGKKKLENYDIRTLLQC